MSDQTSLTVHSSSGAVVFAGLRFSVVGLAAYSIWAFAPTMEGGVSACALIFILLGGLALYPDVSDRIGFFKFCLTFAAAFVAFAAIWCAVYFVLKGKHGEVLGFLFGVAAMCLVFQRTIGSNKPLIAAIGVAFTCHIAGYLAGDYLFYSVLLPQGLPVLGKLGWGICHGIGFGAGLGWMLQDDRTQS